MTNGQTADSTDQVADQSLRDRRWLHLVGLMTDSVEYVRVVMALDTWRPEQVRRNIISEEATLMRRRRGRAEHSHPGPGSAGGGGRGRPADAELDRPFPSPHSNHIQPAGLSNQPDRHPVPYQGPRARTPRRPT
jgi:hypothetical protein